MDIFGLVTLQDFYFAIMLAITAFVIALLATWFSHRKDKQLGDRHPKKPRRQKNT